VHQAFQSDKFNLVLHHDICPLLDGSGIRGIGLANQFRRSTVTLRGTPGVVEKWAAAIVPQLLAVLEAERIAEDKARSDLTFEQVAHIADESELVWLKDPKQFPYLRQDFATVARPDTDLREQFHKDGELIGYAKLSPAAKTTRPRLYYRRYFWLKTDGRDPFPGPEAAPCEAVKVSSIAVGRPAQSGRD
jgi:hypothetical protein